MRLKAAALTLLALAGCASSGMVPEAKRTKTFDAPKDQVVTAVVRAVSAEGYAVETTDRRAGLVVTEKRQGTALGGAMGSGVYSRVRGMVRETGTGTRLTLNVEYFRGLGADTPVPANGDPQDYQKWFSRIKQQIQRND